MKQYEIKFSGKEIGTQESKTTEYVRIIEAVDKRTAHIRLYDTHEYIKIHNIKELEGGE